METLSIVVSYFGVVVLFLTLFTYLSKRRLEKIANRIVAIHSATLLLDGDDIHLEALKKEYKKITQGSLLNYEAIEIIDEVQKILKRDQIVDLVGGEKVFEEIKSEIPNTKEIDQTNNCSTIFALPVLMGFLGFRNSADSGGKVILYSLLIVVPSVLFLGYIVYPNWFWFFSVMRRWAKYRREYISRLRGRAKLS
jgi:hypothetical protein